MKKTTKKMLALLSATAMLAGAGAAYADEDDAHTDIVKSYIADVQTSDEAVGPGAVDHGYLVGSITVRENGETIVSDDGETVLYKPEAAFVLGADGGKKSFDDIKAGDRITYYVDGDSPMTLQLPVHYSPDVIVIEDEGSDVSRRISVFDENGLSAEGDLVLNYGPDTPYYSHTREAAFISGKALVFYSMMTMSIPAQTNPVAIVRLKGDAEGLNTPANKPIAVAPSGDGNDLSGVTEIKVGEVTLGHIPVTVNNVQMLPVRAVAEALGFTVGWDGENRRVDVGHAFFGIDEDSYTIGRAMPQSLGQAPVLIALPGETAATTYVPVSFFTDVLGINITVDGTVAAFDMVQYDAGDGE